ncbi:hypothetical protein BHE74_00046081 [Ensete ventricosum]|nr:hypothetical protein BHE74_00046081 [Ensete ventricosum]
MTDPYYPYMRVDFPRWEEEDLIGWISHVERYFRYHKITDASMVEIMAIHLKRDAIQWFDWFEHTHSPLKEGLLIHFGPTNYENWSREHRCKKGRLLMIKPMEEEVIEHPEESLEHEEEDMGEEPQLTDFMVHVLSGYTNPQMMKVVGLLKQQSITVLINTGNTNNFLKSKVDAWMTFRYKEGGRRIGGGGQSSTDSLPPATPPHRSSLSLLGRYSTCAQPLIPCSNYHNCRQSPRRSLPLLLTSSYASSLRLTATVFPISPTHRHPCCQPSSLPLPLLQSLLPTAAVHLRDLAALFACRQPRNRQPSVQSQPCDHLSVVAASGIILYSSSASPSALLLLLSLTVAPVGSISPPITVIPPSFVVAATSNHALCRCRSLLSLLHLLAAILPLLAPYPVVAATAAPLHPPPLFFFPTIVASHHLLPPLLPIATTIINNSHHSPAPHPPHFLFSTNIYNSP